jgi:hypothetical protein
MKSRKRTSYTRFRSSRGRENIAGVGGRVDDGFLLGVVTSMFVDCWNATSLICVGMRTETVLGEAWNVHSHCSSTLHGMQDESCACRLEHTTSMIETVFGLLASMVKFVKCLRMRIRPLSYA